MNKKFRIYIPSQILILAFSLIIVNLMAQADKSTTVNGSNTGSNSEIHKPNIIKINLLALPLRTLTIQYERVINKTISVALAGRVMPQGGLPFKNWFFSRLGDSDPEVQETIDDMQLSNFAITPEIRIYISKDGFGNGFYLAPSYRFAQYNISNLNNTFFNSEDQENSLSISGRINAHYGGLTMGTQWSFGKYFSLDWWIFAPFIGVERTNINGKAALPLTEEDKLDLIEDIESIDILYTTITYDVHTYGADIQVRGLMAGISAGIALGFRF